MTDRASDSFPGLVQDLSSYRTPPGFRGRSAVIVQLWWIVQSTLFGCSPQFMYGWRRWLLRLFGAGIDAGVLIRPSVRIVYPWKLKIGQNSWIGDFVELYCLGPIEVGADVCVSQYAMLMTGSHDYRSVSFDIFVKPIKVEDECWISSGAFIHPGVTLGRGSVIGARAMVFEDTRPYSIHVGAPSRLVGSRLDHAQR